MHQVDPKDDGSLKAEAVGEMQIFLMATEKKLSLKCY
jgi:hypothetical protein